MKMEKRGTEYTCSYCEKTFLRGRDDEAAAAEAEKNNFDVSDCAIVCTDCLKTIMDDMHEGEYYG